MLRYFDLTSEPSYYRIIDYPNISYVKRGEYNNDRRMVSLVEAIARNDLATIRQLFEESGRFDPFYKRSLALHFAVGKNVLKAAKLLLECGVDTDNTDENGSTPLHIAAYFNLEDMVTMLLQAGARADILDRVDRTPLHVAIGSRKKSSANCAEILIRAEMALDICGGGGRSPLHLAVMNGADLLVALLIEHKADPTLKTVSGDTALHLALSVRCFEANPKCATALISCGKGINISNEMNYTPLHLALLHAPQTMESLLVKGADVTATDKYGATALHMAAKTGNCEVIARLIDAGADVASCNKVGHTAYHTAICMGHTEAALLVLQKGVNIKARDLRTAVEMGHTEAVRLLLQKGANINGRSKEGTTPIHLAAEEGCEELVTLLIAHDADLTMHNKAGDTALHSFIRKYTPKASSNCAAALFAEGSSNNICEAREGNTPLQLAIQKGSEDMFAIALKYEVDLTILNKSGANALHMAVQCNRADFVCRLVKNGADVDSRGTLIIDRRSTEGVSALHLAVELKFIPIIRLLLSLGAPVDSQDEMGNTALHAAVRLGDYAIALLLTENGADISAYNHLSRYARAGFLRRCNRERCLAVQACPSWRACAT